MRRARTRKDDEDKRAANDRPYRQRHNLEGESMAQITGSKRQKKLTINKFLGLMEQADGETQVRPGVATRMENFALTDVYHLATRPGILTLTAPGNKILALWAGYYNNTPYLVAVGNTHLTVYDEGQGTSRDVSYPTLYSLTEASVFEFGGYVYILAKTTLNKYYWRVTMSTVGGNVTASLTSVTGYVPLVVTGASPAGGGTTLERINLLTRDRRVEYSADGESTDFVLPEKVSAIYKVLVDNVDVTNAWSLSLDGTKASTGTAPAEGVNNVEIYYTASGVPDSDRDLILGQRYAEAFNGATDTRIFLYGDGTNKCYYTGITEAGAPSAEYFPALNEIGVDDTNTPITGMARHYGRLMVFKPDGTYTISYDTIYLADGTSTAGFRLKPMHREIGSDAMGKLAVCDNFIRTYCRGNIYEWKQTASYYQDERYAKVVSLPVQKSILAADADMICMFDDDMRHRFLFFLNDAAGTVLVHDYELDAWYKWLGFKGVHNVVRSTQNDLYFSSEDTQTGTGTLCKLSDNLSYDYIRDLTGWHRHVIDCVWESGYMAFGSESLRKYSSYIWTTLLAGPGAVATFTVQTDRRAEYAEKTHYANTTGLFDATEFDRFSFETYLAPFAKRLKLKVKKFVYYKLIITSEDPLNEDEPLYPQTFTTWAELPQNDGGVGAVCVMNVDMSYKETSDAK